MINDPYVLPEGNVLVSFSGGRTSGYMLHKIVERNGTPDRMKVVFTNTGREMSETYDFVQRCSEEFEVPISWLEYTRQEKKGKLRPSVKVVSHNSAARNGEPFDALIQHSGGDWLPDIMRRKCTQELKVKTIKRFLVSQGWKKWTNTLGIRWDEQRRIKESKDVRFSNWYPLADAQAIKKDVGAFWKSAPFDLALPLVDDKTPLSNCDGCFLKSEAHLAFMWEQYPERMQWWSDKEVQTGKVFRFKQGSYEGIRQAKEQQMILGLDEESFFCQVDGGECTGD